MNSIIRNSVAFVCFLFLLAMLGCGGENHAWKNASEIGSQRAYEDFIASYPDSTHAKEAKIIINKLVAEAAWTQAASVNTIEAYRSFLANYPDSVHAEDAKIIVTKLVIEAAWAQATSADTLDAYRSFLTNYPDSLLKGLALEKIKEVEEAAWKSALKINTADAFQAFISRFPESKYGGTLSVFSKGVRKAIEDRIIHKIARGDLGSRFSIKKIKVNTYSKGGRFLIEPRMGGARERLTLSTVYPGDWFPLELQLSMGNINSGGMVTKMTGRSLVPGLQKVHYANGTVWRISGTVNHLLSQHLNYSERYVIDGDKVDPLSFYLLQGAGAVYLHGRGSIKTSSGDVIFATR